MLYTAENTVAAGNPVKVFVDGVLIPCATKADTEAGYAESIGPSPYQPDTIHYTAHRGTVTVEPA